MTDQGAPSPERDLGWLLDDLAARVEQFRQAVILSRDGLVIAASRDLSREDAEHMAALAAGLQSLARGERCSLSSEVRPRDAATTRPSLDRTSARWTCST